jgi:YggT family protein
MISLIVSLINLLSNILVILIIVDSFVSFFLAPFNQIRRALDGIIQPLLSPIRRVVPLVGMFDFSPLILIILVEIITFVLTNFLSAL